MSGNLSTSASDEAPDLSCGRDRRQAETHAWCVAAFGDHDARSIPQRGLRLMEEAIETAQACGCDPAMLHRLIDHVYAKPVDELHKELGGLGVTLLGLAEAAGMSADEAERREIARVMGKPLSHFAARNAAKTAAGFHVPDGAGSSSQ
jgi:NTP pyrophosphatase (non-canonical NTP hydrolase)